MLIYNDIRYPLTFLVKSDLEKMQFYIKKIYLIQKFYEAIIFSPTVDKLNNRSVHQKCLMPTFNTCLLSIQ